jgi:hypothetical protein
LVVCNRTDARPETKHDQNGDMAKLHIMKW